MWGFLREKYIEADGDMVKKIFVIGLGSMGKRRIRLLKELDNAIEIVGIDSKMDRRMETAEKFDIMCVSDIKEYDGKAGCAFVCTPPQFHAPIIRECLQRELHVFSEINLVDDMYEENICLAKEKKRILFLSSTSMYKEEMQYVDQRVKENGKPCAYQYHVGQYLPDWHPWDNLQDFFVSNKKTNGCREYLAIELPWIQRTFGKIMSVHTIKRNLSGLDLDFPDTYVLQIEHENGTIGSLVVDVVSRQAVHHLEVFNDEFYIRWNGTLDSLCEKDLTTGELKTVGKGNYRHEQGYADFVNEIAYLKETENFFEVMKGGVPLYSFEEDIETLRIIDEIEG